MLTHARSALSSALEYTSLRNSTLTAAIFGRYYDGTEVDWTFRNLQKPGDEMRESDIVRLLPGVAGDLGARRVLAPSPVAQNGVITSPYRLRLHFAWAGIEVARGIEADGCLLEPTEAFAITVGGCAVLVGWRDDNESVVVAHAGRDSIDPFPKQEHAGSPESAFRALDLTPETASHFHGHILLPIAPEVFDHPADHPHYGALNRSRTLHLTKKYGRDVIVGEPRQGRIDIARLIVRQLGLHGVPPENVTVGPSTLEYHGQVYTTREAEPELRSRRNLIIVARHA